MSEKPISPLRYRMIAALIHDRSHDRAQFRRQDPQ